MELYLFMSKEVARTTVANQSDGKMRPYVERRYTGGIMSADRLFSSQENGGKDARRREI